MVSIRLYTYWRSSSAWRVRIALAFKSIPHDPIPVHLVRGGGQQHDPDFRARNPLGQVPVIEVTQDGRELRLTQSMAILEFLEERYPAPPLLPRDPESRARARQLAEMVNSGIQPIQNLALQQKIRAAGVDPVPLVGGMVEAGMKALESAAQSTAGKFSVGDAVSIADAYVVPQMFAARRLGVDVDGLTTLRRIERACEELAPFQAAHPSAQPDYEPS